MSLLMDALRKAEEEKRRAALERQGEAAAPDPQATPDHLASTFPPKSPDANAGSQTGEHTAGNMRLEPLLEGSDPLAGQQAAEAAGSSTGAGSTTNTGGITSGFGETTRTRLTAAQRDVFDALGVPRRNEETGAFDADVDLDSTMPSKRTLKKSLEEYFEPTRSLEGSKRSTEVGMQGRAAVGTDSGPITAQTVFSAKRRGGSSSVFSVAASLLLLGAAGLGAVGAYHWYTQSQVPKLVPSPTVAQGVEKVDVAPLDLPPVAPVSGDSTPLIVTPEPASTAPASTPPVEPAAVPPVETPAVAATAPESVIPVAEPAPADTSLAAAEPAVTPTPATVDPSTITPPPPATTVEPVAPADTMPTAPKPDAVAAIPSPPAAAETAVTTAMIEPPTAATIDSLQAAPVPKSQLPAPKVTSTLDGSVMPGEIRITRTRPAQPVVPGQVQEAYDAYQRGDYNRAETLYRMALARNPQSRDAQLGIAALNWRRGDRQGAAATYARLLQINPNDSVARSALLTLRKDPNAVADESSVKLMLQREENSAHLRFVLGNVYARQARWPEAQQAYFDAYTRDKTNPDFVYNLAVSLDNLGQQRPALDYYRQAVALSGKRPARFAAADARSRIQTLASTHGNPP